MLTFLLPMKTINLSSDGLSFFHNPGGFTT